MPQGKAGYVKYPPPGGTTGQVLAKVNNEDWEMEWTAAGGGSGTVTQVDTGTGLTGGPITTTGTINLANTAVTPGSYTNANITVDAQGRLTAAANGSAGGVTSVTASSPLASSGGATPNISISSSTGSGAVVLATSPTLVTPALGTPSSVTLTNGTGLPVGGISATGTPDNTTFLRGDGTWNTPAGGSGAFTDITSGTNTTAAMVVGTGASLAASGSGTITATAVAVGGITGLGTGVGTFLATPSSANLASAVTDETGTGSLVFATGPTITLRDASVTTTSGDIAYNATTEELNYSNGQRALSDDVGWTPHATAIFTNGGGTNTYNLATVSAGLGGAIAIPVLVSGHMLFETLTIRQVAAANARSAEWRLYRQRLNNGNSGENTLDEVSGANGTFSFTPSAASNESSSVGSPPVYLAPGCYWLVIRNTDATQTFNFSGAAASVLAPNLAQTKSIAALGSTIDMVAATWSKNTSVPNFILKGRVFGETTVF